MPCRRHLLAAITFALFTPAAASAATPGATFEWDLRLRQERVEDAGFAAAANATSARLRAGVRLVPATGWTVLVESEGIVGAGNHNDGANGKTTLPTVLDPGGVELNQAWVGWKQARGGVVLGRQRIALDNQRWVGSAGWRQNEQTFDALGVQWQPAAALAIGYYWLDKVHRVAGDRALNRLARERDLDTHLLHLAWKQDAQRLAAYTYLHRDRDVAGASTATYGLRWTGGQAKRGFGWSAEYARQLDHARNPIDFNVAYWLLEPTWTRGRTTLRAGWEHLGGTGASAVQTPLASLHAFNGWDDQFGSTPAHGLEDRYLGAGGAWGRGPLDRKLAWMVTWHDYRADVGGRRYGSEWNASLGFPLPGGLGGLVKLADYRAAGFSRDNRKLWLQVEWRGARTLAP